MKTNLFVTTIAIFISTSTSWAAELRETWIQTGNPSVAETTKWKSLQSSRGAPSIDLRVLLDGAPSESFSTLRAISGLSKIQIISAVLPTSASIQKWIPAAAAEVEFVSLSGRYPTSREVETLNTIGFKHILFALGRYPEKSDALTLQNLHTPFSLHFNLIRYPTYIEKFPIAMLPLDTPLLFSVDTWPRYIQMDTWNLIPQSEKHLLVSETMLTDETLPYVQNLKGVTEITFKSQGDVSGDLWKKLGAFDVRWSMTNAVPSEKALGAFHDSETDGGKRRLLIDRDGPMSSTELERLRSSNLEIEWIHEAP